ncbi:MAG: hypothetical protein GX045_01165, partial [Clostridiaceae bacterium]|nr:hypothetical protein [Clostridiaceae bacterium]
MKRFIPMVLIVVLMLTLFTACDTTQSGKTSTQQTGDSSTQGKVHKLKVLGPVNESAEIKFAEREEYPIWHKFEEMLKAKNLEITYETVPSDQYSV